MSLLKVRDLRIASGLAEGERTITSGIDLDVERGQALGIVGESGSGKSMTARAIVGLLPSGVRATGSVEYEGRNLLDASERELCKVRGSEIALIFQDPFTSLNPLMRCGAQIVELLRDERGKKLSRAARRAEAERRLAEVGIHDPAVVEAYPFELSGGMRQRVGIAAALALDPKLVIADEPSTALDVTTQKEILGQLKALQEQRGLGLILITHDLRVAFSMCDRIAVLYSGALLESAPAHEVEAKPMHPYTQGLLLSEPPVDRRLAELTAIGGSVPEPDDVAHCCAFSARCQWCGPECTDTRPSLAEDTPGRFTACMRIDGIADEMARARAAAAERAHVTLEVTEREPLIEVRALHKAFDASRSGRRTVALGAVDIDVAAGESVGIVGESGSGKTTLVRSLLGLETPTSGHISIDGIDASDWSRLSTADRKRLRRTVQMVFQDPYSTLNPVRTVGATIAESLTAHDPSLRDVRARTRELMEQVGLPAAYAERKPVALSGGERQRVAIARALAAQPRLLACDEPVSALDVSVQAQILNLLARLRREMGIGYLFITHDLAVVRQVVDRVYVLQRGEVVESGPVDDVLDNPQHAYTRLLVDSVPRSDDPLAEPEPVDA